MSAAVALSNDATAEPGHVTLTPMAELAMLRAMMMSRLRPAAIKVGTFLLSRYNSRVGGAWPKHETIAAACEMQVRSARRAIDELAEAGWFVVEDRSGRSKLYRPVLANGADPWRGNAAAVDKAAARCASEAPQLRTGAQSPTAHVCAPNPPISSEPNLKNPIGPAVERKVVDMREERPIQPEVWNTFSKDRRRLILRLKGKRWSGDELRALTGEDLSRLEYVQDQGDDRALFAAAAKIHARVTASLEEAGRPSRNARTAPSMEEEIAAQARWIEELRRKCEAESGYGWDASPKPANSARPDSGYGSY